MTVTEVIYFQPERFFLGGGGEGSTYFTLLILGAKFIKLAMMDGRNEINRNCQYKAGEDAAEETVATGY